MHRTVESRQGGVSIDGCEIRCGSRVRLAPRKSADVFDLALAGRTARVEGIDTDRDGGIHLAVVLDSDPGYDLGGARFFGHRFFFRADEVEPVADGPRNPAPTTPARA